MVIIMRRSMRRPAAYGRGKISVRDEVSRRMKAERPGGALPVLGNSFSRLADIF